VPRYRAADRKYRLQWRPLLHQCLLVGSSARCFECDQEFVNFQLSAVLRRRVGHTAQLQSYQLTKQQVRLTPTPAVGIYTSTL